MVPKSILLCLPVFLCHSLTAAMAQSASYYSVKQKFWWPAFSLLDRHQKMFKVSRWSGRNSPKPGCALHWEGERTPFATTSTESFPYSYQHCHVFCVAIPALWKRHYSRMAANRERENKQALPVTFSSSVQGVVELYFALLTATQLPHREAPTKVGWSTQHQFVEVHCISMS